MKTGILLAASSSVHADARAALACVERRVTARFGSVPVRWAVTAGPVRHVLHAQGEVAESPDDALAAMRRDGFTHVAVQSLHIVPGSEYRALYETVEARRRAPESFASLQVGPPLLASDADSARVVQALLPVLAAERRPGDAAILIAHGSREPAAERAYDVVARTFAAHDGLILLGRTLGRPDRDETIRICVAAGALRACLLPFTVTSGSTVRAALAPDGKTSWPAALRAADIDCRVVSRGLAAHDAIVDIWLEHLRVVCARTWAPESGSNRP